jgi:hypothetical protein
MEQINKYKLTASMVRGFFVGFFSGLLDSKVPDWKKNKDARVLKKLAAEHYETIHGHFANVLFPLLLTTNFESYEAALEDMNKRHFSNATPVKLLLRYACRDKELFEALVEEYQRQMVSILQGRLQPLDEFYAGWKRGESVGELDVDHAIRNTVRALMHGYTLGIKASGVGKTSLHQASVFRLMISGMMMLLHDEVFDVWEGTEESGLDGVFRKVCINAHNYETLVNEMNQAYEDLARAEGIESADDTVN